MATPTVELQMIVRDGAARLAACLESASGLVDRIVIGDTGSTDNSLAIARSFGAEIVSVPWQEDFAHARNCVLQAGRCDWILILDADEMLDPTAAETLPEALARQDIFAYEGWIWNYVLQTHSRFGEQGAIANPLLLEASRPFPAFVKSLNTRLFRRHPGIFFERPVHETVSGRLTHLGLACAASPFVIHHFGQAEDSEPTRRRKNDLYQQIGRSYLERNPGDRQTLFELGLGELEHHRRPQAALPLFVRSIEANPEDPKAFLFTGICLLRLQRLEEALQLLEHSALLDPRSIVLHEAIGDCHFQGGTYPAARVAYSRARTLGGTSALILAKLGAAEVHLGDTVQGLLHVREALEREPGFAELYDMASATALLADSVDLAAEYALKRLDLSRPTPFHFVFAASLSLKAGDPSRWYGILARGLAEFPSSAELQSASLTLDRSQRVETPHSSLDVACSSPSSTGEPYFAGTAISFK